MKNRPQRIGQHQHVPARSTRRNRTTGKEENHTTSVSKESVHCRGAIVSKGHVTSEALASTECPWQASNSPLMQSRHLTRNCWCRKQERTSGRPNKQATGAAARTKAGRADRGRGGAHRSGNSQPRQRWHAARREQPTATVAARTKTGTANRDRGGAHRDGNCQPQPWWRAPRREQPTAAVVARTETGTANRRGGGAHQGGNSQPRTKYSRKR